MSKPSSLETAQGVVYSAMSVGEPTGWPPDCYLPLAVAQLAIMSATPSGARPESLDVRLSRLDLDGEELSDGFYLKILTENEVSHLPAAQLVVGLIAAQINDEASRSNGRGLIR